MEEEARLTTYYLVRCTPCYSLLPTGHQLRQVEEEARLVLCRQPQLGRERWLRLGERRRHDSPQRDLQAVAFVRGRATA